MIDNLNKITVATCCYENDWKLILSDGYLGKIFNRFNYDFYEKMLIINTTNNREEIIIAAEREVEKGNIDTYFFVSEVLEEIKSSLKISDFLYYHKFRLFQKHNNTNLFKSIIRNIYSFYFFHKGNGKRMNFNEKVYDCTNYSVGPLSAIIKASGDYLLYFTEDCIIGNEKTTTDWINNSIEHMKKNEQFIASRPIDIDLDKNWINAYDTIDDFYICYMFTDRMFLSSIDTLKSIDYNCADCGKYPPYGGAGFEARVFNYMDKNDKRILISKNDKYIHEYNEYMNFINK